MAVCPEYKLKGIYGIRNKVNNHIYIGSANVSFQNRWYDHRTQLKNNKHSNIHLQNAYNKYGVENFEYFIIEIVDGNRATIFEVEQYYLDVFYGQPFCYNLNPKATGGTGWFKTRKGTKLTDEEKAKLSKAQRARRLRDGTAKKVKPKKAVGRPFTDPKQVDTVLLIKAFFPNVSLRWIQKITSIDHSTVRNILKANELPNVVPIS